MQVMEHLEGKIRVIKSSVIPLGEDGVEETGNCLRRSFLSFLRSLFLMTLQVRWSRSLSFLNMVLPKVERSDFMRMIFTIWNSDARC